MNLDRILKRINGTFEEQVELIAENTEQQLKILLKTDYIPNSKRYIVEEITLVRVGRIGSEAYESESLARNNIRYYDRVDDFKPYQREIDDFVNRNSNQGGRFSVF